MSDGLPIIEGVKFILDGARSRRAPGETIWQVASRHGTEIPHLCYSPAPGYRPDGNCRACMVEIEGERVLAASCIRRPTPGMKVRTASERAESLAQAGLRAARRRPARARGRARPELALSGAGPTASASPTSRFPAIERANGRRSQPSGDGGAARRLHPLQPLRPRLPRGPGQRRHRHGGARAPREDRLRLRRPDGRLDLRRLRRVRAGLPDRRADAGDASSTRQGVFDGERPRPRGRQRLPLLRRRLPAHLPDQGRPHRRGRRAATARRTRTGSASRAASASTTCIIRTG